MHFPFLLGLAAAAGAQPPADPFCADLARIIRAAAETPPFASIPPFTGGPGLALLGFPNNCGRSENMRDGRVFSCARQLPGPKLRVDPLAAQVQSCLPAAQRLPDAANHGIFEARVVRFRAQGVTIELAEGGWRTAGGGQVSLRVRPVR